jgi:hypothetical protein
MPDWDGIGKLVMAAGLLLALLGFGLTQIDKASGLGPLFGWVGKLPGDFLIKRDHVTFYFPLATGVVISVVLSLLLYFFSRR